jgi:hypothetical protein
MPSIYDVISESCAALAAKTGRASDKVRLLQLADQWRSVPADGQGPGKGPPVAATLAGATVQPVGLLARPPPKSPVSPPKPLSDEIKSNPKWAKEDALDRIRDAIGILRELGIGEDTILKQLGLVGERKPGRKPAPFKSASSGPPPFSYRKERERRSVAAPRNKAATSKIDV